MVNFIERRAQWLMILPAVILLIALTVYPLIHAANLSLHRYNLDRPWIPRDFVGLGNFLDFFSDSYLREAMLVTLKFGLGAVAIQLIVGFSIAWLLNRKIVGSSIFRVIYLLPLMVVPVVSGLIWRTMFNYNFGVLNWMLEEAGGEPRVWLGAGWALPSVLAASVWQWLPFSILIFTVALSSIPREYYEAAAVDGASRWATFRHVTLPNLRWALLIVTIFGLSDAIKSFDTIYTLTGGGPGIETQTLALYIQKQSFTHFEMGYAAALSFLILFTSFIIIFPLIRKIGTNEPSKSF